MSALRSRTRKINNFGVCCNEDAPGELGEVFGADEEVEQSHRCNDRQNRYDDCWSSKSRIGKPQYADLREPGWKAAWFLHMQDDTLIFPRRPFGSRIAISGNGLAR
ncbi:hypothetical protein XPA_001240 [Xanthoria parietina]